MPIFGFIGGIGPWELGIILVIVLILFGAGKLPQVFESFGKGMKAFRDAQKDDSIDVSPGDSHRELSEHEELDAHEVEREKQTTAR